MYIKTIIIKKKEFLFLLYDNHDKYMYKANHEQPK